MPKRSNNLRLSGDVDPATIPWCATATGKAQGQVLEVSEGDGPGTWEGVAYSGGEFRQWFGRCILDLEGFMPGAERLPSLLNHATGWTVEALAAVGYTTGLRVEMGQVFASGVYLSSDAGQRVRAMALEGFPWALSLWTDIENVEVVPEGGRAMVNGREVVGPIYVGRKWSARECAHCEVGADSGASLQFAAAGQTPREDSMPGQQNGNGAKGANGAKGGAGTQTQATEVDLATIDPTELRQLLEAERPDLVAELKGEGAQEAADAAAEAAENAGEDAGGGGSDAADESMAAMVKATAGPAADFAALSTLASACGADAGYIIEAQAAGWSVARASAELARRRGAQVVELQAKLAAVGKELGNRPATGQAGDDLEGGASAGAGTKAHRGQVFAGLTEAHTTESGWAASAQLREYFTGKAGGNESKARALFDSHAGIVTRAGGDWRKCPG